MELSLKEIKKNARKNLKGKWHIMILITMLYSISGLILNLIPDKMNSWNSFYDILNISFILIYITFRDFIILYEILQFCNNR